MSELICNDLRSFIQAGKQISDWKEIKGADCELREKVIRDFQNIIPFPKG